MILVQFILALILMTIPNFREKIKKYLINSFKKLRWNGILKISTINFTNLAVL